MLKYVGDGWIPGVPARDLSDAEIKALAKQFHKDEMTFTEYLVEMGLYVKVKPEPAANKLLSPEKENK